MYSRTCNINPSSSLADQLGNPAGECPDSDSISAWEDYDITICQLHSSSILKVPVSSQDDSIFRELEPKPPYFKKVVLHTAGRDMKMDGFCCMPNGPKTGENTLHRVNLCKVANGFTAFTNQ